MKTVKDVLENIWEKEPCNNPLEPAKWEWVLKFIHGSRSLVLTCTNSLWRYIRK